MKYAFGDVVVVSFPFTNLDKTIRRPALVLIDTGDEDIVVARITTHKHNEEMELEIENYREKGLLLSSFVRFNKIATLNRKDMYKKIGELSPSEVKKARKILRKMFLNNQREKDDDTKRIKEKTR
ncbi:type II toxin-antitoxin system PemK/MazF family toxin [Desulfurella amilsii]|nr:type II toxin-antitoxin system PemK/MazF family toxin [Desulfurella amilsii]